MNNQEMIPSPVEVVNREPVDILNIEARKKLEKLFPEAGDKIDKIISSFVMDILSEKNIPTFLHRMSPEKQKELLLSVGATTVPEAIELILNNISESTIIFYKNKLVSPTEKI